VPNCPACFWPPFVVPLPWRHSANQKQIVLVDIEICDATGKRVSQTVKDNVSFTAGKSQSFNVSWTASAAASKGSYTVKVGIFRLVGARC